TYRSARVESHYKSHITAILTQLGVQCRQPCSKIPPGASETAISFQPSQSGPARKGHPDEPVQPRQAGLPVDPTAPIRVCSFQGVEPTSQAPFFQAFLDISRIPGLGIIIPDSEKLGLLGFLCVCGEIRREYSRATTRVRARFEAARVGTRESSLDFFVSHDLGVLASYDSSPGPF
ncbi:hypothetical protein CRG98_033109, partial [Punica granatum]